MVSGPGRLRNSDHVAHAGRLGERFPILGVLAFGHQSIGAAYGGAVGCARRR